MTAIRLTGRLICASDAEAGIVRDHLPEHVRATLAEPGCRSFAVTATEDPHIWDVAEEFVDDAAFAAHQDRVRESPWGRATAGISRDYVVTGR